MKEIKINIPEYDDALSFIWDEGFAIKTATEHDAITIEANSAGLLSLALQLILLAQKDVPGGSHFHLDAFNALEEGSAELIISKNENL